MMISKQPDKYTRHQEIAQRLLGLRESLNLSQEELANKVNTNPEMVAIYESGKSEIPVSYLMDIAHVCHIDLTELISGTSAFLKNYTVVRKGEGEITKRRKDYNYLNLASRLSGRLMEPFMVKVPPKDKVKINKIVHKGQEFIYVLEGRLELHLNKDILILEKGDSVYFNSTTAHGLRGLDDKEAIVICVII